MPDVYWLIAAQRHLLASLVPAVKPDQLAREHRALCGALARTFPDAGAVVVRDRLSGFRPRSDVHVLLVEVFHRCAEVSVPEAARRPEVATITIGKPDFDEPTLGTPTRISAHIVKIGKPEQLHRELEAWETARPIGMTHHSVLMALRPGARSADDKLESIIYEDAHHVLGGNNVISLEQACLDCVRWGLPTASSLELAIKTLYEQLGADFYPRSYTLNSIEGNVRRLWEGIQQDQIEVDPVARTLVAPNDVQVARQNLLHSDFAGVWQSLKPLLGTVEEGRLQQFVNLETLREPLSRWLGEWRDSFDNAVVAVQPDRLRIRRELVAALSNKRNCFIDPVDYLSSVLDCPQHCPLLLWGCSHGDLHGRNVLITLVDGSATLPAVFDYEDMGLEKLIGWDFVKLETELKVRALYQIAGGDFLEFVGRARKLECHLAEWTHALHDARKPKIDSLGLTPEEQILADIILAVRQSAREHLGRLRNRDRQWLEEYYFLLACYGVCAARYETYQPRHVAVALLSAGVAARLLARPWYGLEPDVRARRDEARRLLSEGADPQQAQPGREPSDMTHHARLAFAGEWCRSADRKYVEAAANLLESLRRDYPHILEIEEELVLQYLELGRQDQAEALLYQVSRRYNQISEEMLCRFGRHWKEQGAAREPKEAAAYFKQALVWYRRAFELRGNYYPGINLATLQFLLADNPGANATLERVRQSARQTTDPGEIAWVQATLGEAHLLQGNHVEAERCYKQAVAGLPKRDRQSSRRQAELILKYSRHEGKELWGPARLDDIFGPDTSPNPAQG